MTEHVHEWYYKRETNVFECACGKWGNVSQFVDRLNATERLSALIVDLMEDAKDGPNEMGGPFIALSVVANILEGKDD